MRCAKRDAPNEMRRMKCPPDHAVLLDYASGRLEAARAIGISRHVEQCAACEDRVLGYAAVSEALDEWRAPAVSVDFNRRLWRAIDATESEPWHRRCLAFFRTRSVKTAIPVAAALTIAAGLLMVRPYAAAPPPASGVSVTEADQAERTLDDIQLLRQFDDALANPAPAKPM